MKSLVQFVVASAVGVGAVQILDGTPFNNVIVYGVLFLGTMYATAVVQHYIHWRRSKRG